MITRVSDSRLPLPLTLIRSLFTVVRPTSNIQRGAEHCSARPRCPALPGRTRYAAPGPSGSPRLRSSRPRRRLLTRGQYANGPSVRQVRPLDGRRDGDAPRTASPSAAYWRAHNDRLLRDSMENRKRNRPRCGWCSATPPRRDSAHPARTTGTSARSSARCGSSTGRPWRVLNLSVSGALIRDVRDMTSCPCCPSYGRPGDLRDRHSTTSCTPARASCSPTCGRCSPRCPTTRSCSTCRCRPDTAGLLGLASRALRGADQPHHPPGRPPPGACRSPRCPGTSCPRGPGKFACDCFHPSQHGYRDWTAGPARPPSQPPDSSPLGHGLPRKPLSLAYVCYSG